MGAPYLLTADLLQQPLGVAWTAFGGGPTTASPPDNDNASALLIGCEWASAEVNREANQNLGCALVSQDYYVRSHRASVQPNGTVRLLADLFPVVNVVLALTAPTAQPWPKNWLVIPPGAAWPERRPVGVYGTSEPAGFAAGGNGILIGAGYGGIGGWSGGPGRGGVEVFVNYVHGWPHSVLLSNCDASAPSLVVDEVADAVPLIREVATKIKRGGGIASGQIVRYCLGDYRVTLLDESIDVVNSNVSIGE